MHLHSLVFSWSLLMAALALASPLLLDIHHSWECTTQIGKVVNCLSVLPHNGKAGKASQVQLLGADCKQWQIQGRAPLPLFSDQTEAQRANKNFGKAELVTALRCSLFHVASSALCWCWGHSHNANKKSLTIVPFTFVTTLRCLGLNSSPLVLSYHTEECRSANAALFNAVHNWTSFWLISAIQNFNHYAIVKL